MIDEELPSGLTADAWLSERLGVAAFHKRDLESPFVRPSGPAFVDAKVPTAQVATARALQDEGFRVVDTALTFGGRIIDGPPAPGVIVRQVEVADRREVRGLARAVMTTSRFHLDPCLDDEVASELKAEWVDGFFAGRRGDQLLVAEIEGDLAGFALLLERDPDTVIVDLIGTSSTHRQRGVGRSLMCALPRTTGVGFVTVGTQASNIPSVGLYTGVGLRLTASTFVLHLHVADTA